MQAEADDSSDSGSAGGERWWDAAHWGAASLPPSAFALPRPAPPPPPSLQAAISSTEHLSAYADYCKRALSNALARVQARSDEVRAVAAGVERARRAALGDALESLRAAEARHAALLSSHADELRRGLDALQRCAEEAARACASSGPPLPFLHRFRELSDAIERLSSKPLPEGADVDVEAWEREAEAVAAPPDRDAAVLLKLLAVKDHLIWALVEERDGLRAALAEQRAEEGRGGGGDDSR